jgi:HEAT repeat protein
MTDLAVDDISRLLLTSGRTLPGEVRQQIVALGPDAIAPLRAILDDDRLNEADSPGQGWAPIHAARLLGELRAEAAIPRLVVLAGEHPLSIVSESAIQALRGLGELVVEPALAVATTTDNADLRGTLADILADTGRKDERIFALLQRTFDEEPELIAGALGNYGDPRAIPILVGFLERYQLGDDDSVMADHVIIEVEAALEALGAELTDAQRQTLDRMRAVLERRRQAMFAPLEQALARRASGLPVVAKGRGKVGRNDPCPCGSGKKFKKCCGQ